MDFQLKPLNESDTVDIAGWHYDGVYAFYDLHQDGDDLAELLNFASWDNYFSVCDEQGDLVCFFYLKPDLPAVEIGLGLAFVEAGLVFAMKRYSPTISI
jgi:ribosomal-protein-alanine N-acetyltransferase